jgi:hypothetical protein
MSLGHIIVIVFMLITAGFIVWLEMNSRKNAREKERAEQGGSESAGGGAR